MVTTAMVTTTEATAMVTTTEAAAMEAAATATTTVGCCKGRSDAKNSHDYQHSQTYLDDTFEFHLNASFPWQTIFAI